MLRTHRLPLLIGVGRDGQGENFIASDISAILQKPTA